MTKPGRRLASETVSVGLPLAKPTRHFEVSLAYENGRLREVIFVRAEKTAKTGTEMDELFHDLGVALSRIIQGWSPVTGEPMGGPAA